METNRVKPFSSGIMVFKAFPQGDHAVASQVNGNIIEYAARYGEHITYILDVGDLTSVTVGEMLVQYSNDEVPSHAGTWTTLTNNNGDNVAFPAAKFIDAGAYENSLAIGSLALSRVPGKHLRLRLNTITGGNIAINSGIAIISHLRSLPSGVVDDLYALAHHPDLVGA